MERPKYLHTDGGVRDSHVIQAFARTVGCVHALLIQSFIVTLTTSSITASSWSMTCLLSGVRFTSKHSEENKEREKRSTNSETH